MEAVPGDLQAKYQKIATEYSKIRAQASVLKKAVLDEQTRNAELRDTLKEREQTLRKAEQEMDSLTFRNQQLTKRVTVLQEELDMLQAKSKKGKPKGGTAVPNTEFTNHVLDEELQKKIEENAQLLTMMQDKDVAHEEEMQALRERIERLEHELQQYRKVNNDAELKYKAVVEQLEEEKNALQHAVEVKDHALEQCGMELTSVTEQRSQLQKELGSQLQAANATIARHLPFVDSTNLELNELNIPRHERKQQIYSLHVISQAGLHIDDLIAALTDYHTFFEQRLHSMYTEFSPVNRRLSILLKENAQYLRPLEQGYATFQESLEGEGCINLQTIPSLSKFSDQLLIYTSYLGRLLPYHRLSMEEENSFAMCPEALRLCNKEVLHHTSRLTTGFVKLSTYVKLLAAQSKRAQQHPLQSQRRFLMELIEVVKALHEAIKDLYRAFNVKRNLEHEVPTVPERLFTSNQYLVNTLLAAVASSGKLSTVLSDSRTELCKVAGVSKLPTVLSSGTIHPSVVEFKKRASQYISSLDQEEPPTVPYEVALKEHEEVKSNALSHETLKEQLANCRQRAAKVEQDKEHWRLEYQLLHLRHCKRVKDLEGQIQSLSGSTTPHSDDSLDKMMPMDPITVTNFLGRLEAPCALMVEAEAREQEVKNHLIGRINELVAVSQTAETKSATSAAECQVLQKRLELCLQNKLQAETCLQQSQDTTSKLQEDLQTTTHNYETQLSIMSEHLANMNDKLAVQRDEIDQLKYQLSNKSSRKSKQK